MATPFEQAMAMRSGIHAEWDEASIDDALDEAQRLAEHIKQRHGDVEIGGSDGSLIARLVAEIERLRAIVGTRDALARENARLRALVPQEDKLPAVSEQDRRANIAAAFKAAEEGPGGFLLRGEPVFEERSPMLTVHFSPDGVGRLGPRTKGWRAQGTYTGDPRPDPLAS